MILIGTVYLFRTNDQHVMWEQRYNPTGHWWFSTLFAALPVAVLLGGMALLHLKAHIAATLGLMTALLVATGVFHMPIRMALTTAAYGGGYGLFPICWIILPVIFLYQLTVRTGQFESLQKSLTNITPDSRLQLLLIAFAFGAFIEGAAGFGTPVAVCGAILISLGFRPLQAAGLSLIANTAPVAFGALGIPIVALHGVTGLDSLILAKTVSRILAPFCVLVPFWVVWAFSGFRSMIEVWPAILVAGMTFSIAQLVIAAFLGPMLVAILSSMMTIIVLIAFLKIWKPKRILDSHCIDITGLVPKKYPHTVGTAFKAWLPWITLSVLIFVWGLPQFSEFLNVHSTIKITVAGLHNLVWRVQPVVPAPVAEAAIYTVNWLAATGTAILLASIVAGLTMGVRPMAMLKEFLKTIVSIRFTIITIVAMLAIGFITRYCGLDATLGLAFARTGVMYPFFGTLIGWVGTATTGSDTSSNVLFGSLQTITAHQIGVPAHLMASANSAGGVMGKMIDAQSIVVASTATQNYGQEGSILRFVFFHSLALACLVGVLVLLMAYVHPFMSMVAK
ncbi:MAG: L-lactate permease [Acidobacteriaceae bacterium]